MRSECYTTLLFTVTTVVSSSFSLLYIYFENNEQLVLLTVSFS